MLTVTVFLNKNSLNCELKNVRVVLHLYNLTIKMPLSISNAPLTTVTAFFSKWL